jgi:hypothetical protein
MPVASPDQLGLATDLTEKAVVVCGPWGCAWRPAWGWYRPYPYPYPYWGWRPSLLVGLAPSWVGLGAAVGLGPAVGLAPGLAPLVSRFYC